MKITIIYKKSNKNMVKNKQQIKKKYLYKIQKNKGNKNNKLIIIKNKITMKTHKNRKLI